MNKDKELAILREIALNAAAFARLTETSAGYEVIDMNRKVLYAAISAWERMR